MLTMNTILGHFTMMDLVSWFQNTTFDDFNMIDMALSHRVYDNKNYYWSFQFKVNSGFILFFYQAL